MESLTENKALLYSIVGSAGAILALAMGIFPDMAYQFEIVDFPAEVNCCFRTVHTSV
jgi:cation-transporting ATPase 13A1